MIIKNKKLNNNLIYPINEPFNINEIIFFDIETTGLSPKTSYLYLIGLAYYHNNSWCLTQWLLKDPNQEVKLLNLFSNKTKSYKRIIHYNGDAFDIPYLTYKYKLYNLEVPFSNIESFDLYKKVNPYRKTFPFPNLKLKSLESFFAFKRDDIYSGSELISIYSQFVGRCQYEKLASDESIANYKSKQETSKVSVDYFADILLLHNSEDLIGLLEVSAILTYIDFFEHGINKHDILVPKTKVNDKSFLINIQIDYNFPFEMKLSVSSNNNIESIIKIKENHIIFEVPLFNKKLKYYFENYKEYYYLPKEDIAIHKSVARYVDKEFRVRATPSTSYTYIELDTLLKSTEDFNKWLNSLICFTVSNNNTKNSYNWFYFDFMNNFLFLNQYY